MEQVNQLERKIKEFDWKEWVPIIGLYFVPRNVIKKRASRFLDEAWVVNGVYHAAVSVAPIFYVIGKYL